MVQGAARPKFFPAKCEFSDAREKCVCKLERIYNEMIPENWNRETSKPRIIKWYRQFYNLYLELYSHCLQTRCEYGTYYRVYPKFHLLGHVFEESPDNPRDEWCYLDENEIGDCANCAESLNAHNLQRSLIDRYRIV